MFIRIQEPVVQTWKRVFSNILNIFWTKLYQPYPAIKILHLNHSHSIGYQLSDSIKTMPRRSTRRRHHSPATSTGGYKEKRRRVDSDEVSLVSVKSPSRKRNDVKRRRHDSEENDKVSNSPSYDRSSRRRRERSKRSHHRKSPTSGRRAHKYRFRHDDSEDSSTRRRHRDRAKEKDIRIASPVKNRISTYDFPIYCDNERSIQPQHSIVNNLPLQNQQLNSENLVNEQQIQNNPTNNNNKLRISSGRGCIGDGQQQQQQQQFKQSSLKNDNNNLMLNKNINNNHPPLQLDTNLTIFNDTNQNYNSNKNIHRPRMPSPTPSLSLSSESSSPPSSPSLPCNSNLNCNRQLIEKIQQINSTKPFGLKLSTSSSAIQIPSSSSAADIQKNQSQNSCLSRLLNSENLSPKSSTSSSTFLNNNKSTKSNNDYNNNSNNNNKYQPTTPNLKDNSSILPVKPPDMMEIEKLLQQNRLPTHNSQALSSSLPIPSSSSSSLCTNTTNNNNNSNLSSSTGNESDLYTAEIDYMNNYLKSLPDYRELDKNIHKEFQKCEDLYDQIQSINSGLIQQQHEQQQNPLSKSSSHQSILKTSKNQFPLLIQSTPQQRDNWKQIVKAAEPVNTSSMNKTSFPSIFAQFCNKSNNNDNDSKLSRSLSSTNMSTQQNHPIDHPEIVGFIPKSTNLQHNNQEIPSIPNKSSNPILIQKSLSNSCVFRPQGKQNLNDFWLEKKDENTTNKQPTRWNYEKIVSNNNNQQPNLPSHTIDNNKKHPFFSSIEGHGAFAKVPPKTKIPTAIDSNYYHQQNQQQQQNQFQPNKLQKNLSLSHLDNSIRQNVSKEDLYKLICNDPPSDYQKYQNNQNDDNKKHQLEQQTNIIKNIPGFMNLNKSVSLSSVPGLMKSNSKSQIPCFIKQQAPNLNKSNSTAQIPLQQQNFQQPPNQIENFYPGTMNYQQQSVQPPYKNSNNGVQKSSSSSCVFGNRSNQYQPLGPRQNDSKIWSAQSFTVSSNNLSSCVPVNQTSNGLSNSSVKPFSHNSVGIKPNGHQNYLPLKQTQQNANYHQYPIQTNNNQKNDCIKKTDNLPLTKVSSVINIPISGTQNQQAIKYHRQPPPPPTLQGSSPLDKTQKIYKMPQQQPPPSGGDFDIGKRQKDVENMFKINQTNQNLPQPQIIAAHQGTTVGFKPFPLGKSNSTSSVQHSIKQSAPAPPPPQNRQFKKQLPNWSSFVDCSKNLKKLAPSSGSSTLLYQLNNTNNNNINSNQNSSSSNNPGKFIQHSGQPLRQQQLVNNMPTNIGIQQQQQQQQNFQSHRNNPLITNNNNSNKNENDKTKNINKENILKYVPNTYVAPIINPSSLNSSSTGCTTNNSGNTTNSIFSTNAANTTTTVPQSVTTLLQNSIGNSKKNQIYVGKTGNTTTNISSNNNNINSVGNTRVLNQSSVNNIGNINKNLNNNNNNTGSGYNDDKFRSDILSSFDPYYYKQSQYHQQNDQQQQQQQQQQPYNSINSTNKLTKNILPSIDLPHLSSNNFTSGGNNLQNQQIQQQPPPPQRLFKTQSASYLVGGGGGNNSYNQPKPMPPLPAPPQQQHVYQNLPKKIHHPPSTSSTCYNYVDQISSSSVSNCSNNNMTQSCAEIYYEVEDKIYLMYVFLILV